VGLRSLLENAQAAHASAIEALESDIKRGLVNDDEAPALIGPVDRAVSEQAKPDDTKLLAIASAASLSYAGAKEAARMGDTDTATGEANAPQDVKSWPRPLLGPTLPTE
jgi:L-serine deaminase